MRPGVGDLFERGAGRGNIAGAQVKMGIEVDDGNGFAVTMVGLSQAPVGGPRCFVPAAERHHGAGTIIKQGGHGVAQLLLPCLQVRGVGVGNGVGVGPNPIVVDSQ